MRYFNKYYSNVWLSFIANAFIGTLSKQLSLMNRTICLILFQYILPGYIIHGELETFVSCAGKLKVNDLAWF